MDLNNFKITFDGILQTYVTDKIEKANWLINNEKVAPFLEYISTFIFSWWKRLRPYCLWVIYTWLGGNQDKDILHFWIVFELLHSMALIHDDIIDQSKKRHNVETMHTYIYGLIKNHHVAESQAILVGDLLLAWVYELLWQSHKFPEQELQKARINVHNMIEEVILGQMIDVDMMSGNHTSLEMIERKNMYKTASYTFTRPLLTWAILAWANEEILALVKELWNHLWIAFQLRDDFFDITFGDDTKTPFSDIQEWQQTYFTQYIFDHWTQEQQKILHSCMWKSLDKNQIIDLQNIFRDSWALEAGKKLILEHSKLAKDALDNIPFADETKKAGVTLLIDKISHLYI